MSLKAHFAHANGFPAGSYKAIFDNLKGLEVFALDKFAHNPRFPLNDNWENQVEELIEFVTASADEPVVAMGHSFGAVISYIACCKRPELFRGLIMLDPPLITGFARFIFRFAKTNALINRITPASRTQVRKRVWHTDEDLYRYFSSRALFKNMDKRCVEDYIHSVTYEEGAQRQLGFDPDIEANIFRTIPHDLHTHYGKLKCPARLITGGFTDVCVPRLRNPFLKHNPTVTHHALNTGGHMFPLEHPKQTAHAINATLDEWGLTL